MTPAVSLFGTSRLGTVPRASPNYKTNAAHSVIIQLADVPPPGPFTYRLSVCLSAGPAVPPLRDPPACLGSNHKGVRRRCSIAFVRRPILVTTVRRVSPPLFFPRRVDAGRRPCTGVPLVPRGTRTEPLAVLRNGASWGEVAASDELRARTDLTL